MLTAFLTAFYTGRAFFMTFWGPEKLPSLDDPEAPAGHDAETHEDEASGHHHEIGHESPLIMTVPLMLLAAATILLGLVCLFAGLFSGGTTAWFAAQLHHTFQLESLGHGTHAFDWFTAVAGTLVGVLGAWPQLRFSMRSRAPFPRSSKNGCARFTRRRFTRFKVDELYDAVVGPPDTESLPRYANSSMSTCSIGSSSRSPGFRVVSQPIFWPRTRMASFSFTRRSLH